MHLHTISVFILLLVTLVGKLTSEILHSQKKKDITDYNDVDLERLYSEWEKNDNDNDDVEEIPRPSPLNLKELQTDGKTPEDILKITKKGQTVLMFVNVRDPLAPDRKHRPFTEKYTDLWRSMLRNNHVVSEVVLIDDDRAIFMFPDGSQAFEAKDFLLKQAQVTEITLEGQQYVNTVAATKEEL